MKVPALFVFSFRIIPPLSSAACVRIKLCLEKAHEKRDDILNRQH